MICCFLGDNGVAKWLNFDIAQSIHFAVSGTNLGLPDVEPEVWKIIKVLSGLAGKPK